MRETEGKGNKAMVQPAASDAACVLVRIKGGIAQITSHQIAYMRYHNHMVIFELCPQKWTFGHTKTDTYRFKEQFHRFETVMPETRYVDDVSH